jgi:hypothetical protein
MHLLALHQRPLFLALETPLWRCLRALVMQFLLQSAHFLGVIHLAKFIGLYTGQLPV